MGRNDAGAEGLDALRSCHPLESISAKSANDSYLLAFFDDPIDLRAVGPGATAKAANGLRLAIFGVLGSQRMG